MKNYITITQYANFYALEYISPDLGMTIKVYDTLHEAQAELTKIMDLPETKIYELLEVA